MDEAKKIAAEHPEQVTNIDGNEHVWYDSAAIEKVATEVATLVNEANPEAKATAAPLVERMEGLKARIEKLNAWRHERGTSVFFVTHGINPVLGVVDKVLYLAPNGHMFGTVDEVMRSEVLSELYGSSVTVLNVDGRLIVV